MFLCLYTVTSLFIRYSYSTMHISNNGRMIMHAWACRHDQDDLLKFKPSIWTWFKWLNIAWLIMPDRLLWVFQKILNCYEFCIKLSPEFTENSIKRVQNRWLHWAKNRKFMPTINWAEWGVPNIFPPCFSVFKIYKLIIKLFWGATFGVLMCPSLSPWRWSRKACWIVCFSGRRLLKIVFSWPGSTLAGA